MHIVVTGGAGYIGSHTVLSFAKAGHTVAIVDNFANSSPEVLARLATITGTQPRSHDVDVRDEAAVARVMASERPDAVVHFAALKAVGASVAHPLTYYATNLQALLSVLKAMDRADVRRFVFSSSATVYGANPPVPTPEDAPVSATNPYGWTKVMSERVLQDLADSDPRWRIAILRYFNPVGAHPSGLIGEDPLETPNNLLPFVAQVAVGRHERVLVFGDDYETEDGTGVRDFIHVDDLAAGHAAAVERLLTMSRPIDVWNLGTGEGTSVLELLAAFEEASGRDVPRAVVGRRPGDVAVSYAAVDKARRELGWVATRTVADMCADAWRWQRLNPQGYRRA
ncbi:MAG: UDP-glucose 4-epimerase GalE [Mobilicoccus sp.]|nr:UDP-glucose 4-epimerase GalE [Mobilicoccus sp.]